MGLQKTRAVILGSRPLGEADKLVSFYTREFGKIRGVAKGARRVRSKFGSALELFTYGHLVLFERHSSELVSVDHFDIIRPFQKIGEDLRRLGRGAWMVECVGRLSADRDPHAALFGLLLRALHALETARPDRVALSFAFRAVDLLGHRPRLDRCRECGEIPGARAWFDSVLGGVLCATCPPGRESHPLSLQALSGLRRLRGLRWEEKLLAEFPSQIEREMLSTVEGYMAALIGSVPKTGRFLEQTRDSERLDRPGRVEGLKVR